MKNFHFTLLFNTSAMDWEWALESAGAYWLPSSSTSSHKRCPNSDQSSSDMSWEKLFRSRVYYNNREWGGSKGCVISSFTGTGQERMCTTSITEASTTSSKVIQIFLGTWTANFNSVFQRWFLCPRTTGSGWTSSLRPRAGVSSCTTRTGRTTNTSTWGSFIAPFIANSTLIVLWFS